MGWTTPTTWVNGSVPGATDLNTHIRDNENYLCSGRPYGYLYTNTGTDYALTVATTWTTIDNTNLTMTLTTQSGHIRLEAIFDLDQSAGASDIIFCWYNTTTAASQVATARLVVGGSSGNIAANVKVLSIFTGLTPGTAYTFVLQYFKQSGTVSLRRSGYPIVCFGTEF